MPTKTPFFWKLLLDGSDQFVHVTGAPVGSDCTPKAFLQSGRDISGPGLSSKTVTNQAQGVSWSGTSTQPLLALPSPPPSPGQGQAYWRITCTNATYEPSSGTMTLTFLVS